VSDINLLYTGVETDLRSAVRDVLADRCEPARLIAMYDGDRSVVDGLWKVLGTDLGLAALLVPEERGGAGASAREAATVLEELGRTVGPVPFLTSAVVATTALRDTDGQLLSELASGAKTAALGVPFATAPHATLPTVRLTDGRLVGTLASVAGALEADVLLIPAQCPHGIALYAVGSADATTTPVVSLDMTRQVADVTVDIRAGEPVLTDAEPAIRAALEAGAALLASEQVGIARWCLTTTVDYLKERKQFGRPVGGFQALKHRLSEVAVNLELAASTARYAAAALAAEDDDLAVATSVAQAFCSDMAVTAAEEAVQLHAGIGMTWEYPVHVYLKRAKADQIAFGTAGAHRARLATMVDLPGPR
jgi:alkylation response protein AidB-like acyl-CoA dehydrogenase